MVLTQIRLNFPQLAGCCGSEIRQNVRGRWTDGMGLPLQIFLYLQVLDFLTTLLGLRLGASEASPFIRLLMRLGPAWGVLLSKMVALGLAAIVIGLGRVHLFRKLNYWYAALVIWNLFVLLGR